MSTEYSGSVFCCCRRQQTSSPSKKTPGEGSPLKIQEGQERDAGDVVVTLSLNEMGTSNEGMTEQTNRSKTVPEGGPSGAKEQQQGRCEEEEEEEDYPAQIRDSDTLVHPSRMRNSTHMERETEECRREEDISTQAVVAVSNGDDLSPEQLVYFEKMVQRLEAVADVLDSNKKSGSINYDAKVSGIMMERKTSDCIVDDGFDSPSLVLEDGIWNVNNHHGNKDLVISVSDVHQSVSIRGCCDCTIQIEGKADSIAVDKSIRCGVVFHDCIAPLCITECQRLQIQVLGSVPLIHARNTDGLSIYTSQESRDVPVFTTKCSELNLLIPSDGDGGDYREVSIPEQFRSCWKVDRWETDVADIMT